VIVFCGGAMMMTTCRAGGGVWVLFVTGCGAEVGEGEKGFRASHGRRARAWQVRGASRR
jgi:hypothetical protein